jgi:AraC family transcriptional regulator
MGTRCREKKPAEVRGVFKQLKSSGKTVRQGRGDATGPARLLPSAAEEVRDIVDRLDIAQPLAREVLRGDTRLTRRWIHPAFDAYVPPMAGHIIGAYYGSEQRSSAVVENKILAARVHPGAMMVIPHGHDAHWSLSGPIEVSHVYLTQQRLQACADLLLAGGRRVELLFRVGDVDPTAARILELLSQETTLSDPCSLLFVEQAIDLLGTQLVRRHSAFGGQIAPAARRGLADWQVKRVTDYMRDQLDQPIGLDELAALVKLSRYHFCTAFRLATGRTPHEWLTAERIARARELLGDPALRITDIALAVGYQTPSAFAASFRKATGVAPSEFRRRL